MPFRRYIVELETPEELRGGNDDPLHIRVVAANQMILGRGARPFLLTEGQGRPTFSPHRVRDACLQRRLHDTRARRVAAIITALDAPSLAIVAPIVSELVKRGFAVTATSVMASNNVAKGVNPFIIPPPPPPALAFSHLHSAITENTSICSNHKIES